MSYFRFVSYFRHNYSKDFQQKHDLPSLFQKRFKTKYKDINELFRVVSYFRHNYSKDFQQEHDLPSLLFKNALNFKYKDINELFSPVTKD